MKNIEIELKFQLLNPDEFIASLDKSVNKVISNQFQKDTYLTPKNHDFAIEKPIKKWLRLRETNKGASITFKNWHYDENGKSLYCDEYQSKIESKEQLNLIFASLDYIELIVVEKYRHSWMFENVEISVDRVTGLGYFVEFELKADFESKEKAIAYVYSIADKFKVNLGIQDFKGYPFWLLEKKGYSF